MIRTGSLAPVHNEELMVISFTDTWPILFDNDAKPLLGRVRFFDGTSSSTNKKVFLDYGKTQGVSYCLTDSAGSLEHQIYMGYGLYFCKMEKFIGGTYEQMPLYLDDDSKWELVKDLYVDGGDDPAASKTKVMVTSVADLIDTDPSVGQVIVSGYYDALDGCGSRVFVWDAESSLTPDDGYVFASSIEGSGRWRMVADPILTNAQYGAIIGHSSGADMAARLTAMVTKSADPLVMECFISSGIYQMDGSVTLTFPRKVRTVGDLQMGITDGATEGSLTLTFQKGLDSGTQTIPVEGNLCTLNVASGSLRESWFADPEHFWRTASGLEYFLDVNGYAQPVDARTITNGIFHCNQTLNAGQSPTGTFTFRGCSFDGAAPMFYRLYNYRRFLNCGTINASQLTSTALSAEAVAASTGTVFLLDKTLSNDQDENKQSVCKNILLTSLGSVYAGTGLDEAGTAFSESIDIGGRPATTGRLFGNVIYSGGTVYLEDFGTNDSLGVSDMEYASQVARIEKKPLDLCAESLTCDIGDSFWFNISEITNGTITVSPWTGDVDHPDMTFSASRCTLNFTAASSTKRWDLESAFDDCTINIASSSDGSYMGFTKAVFSNCYISAPQATPTSMGTSGGIILKSGCSIEDSVIDSSVRFVADGDALTFTFNRNKITGWLELFPGSSTACKVTDSELTDNVFKTTQTSYTQCLLNLHMAGWLPHDSDHSYVYKGNTGEGFASIFQQFGGQKFFSIKTVDDNSPLWDDTAPMVWFDQASTEKYWEFRYLPLQNIYFFIGTSVEDVRVTCRMGIQAMPSAPLPMRYYHNTYAMIVSANTSYISPISYAMVSEGADGFVNGNYPYLIDVESPRSI